MQLKPPSSRTHGFILIFTLLILLVISIATIGNMKVNLLAEKQGSQVADQALATQSANAALESAQQWLAAQCFKPTPCTCPSTSCKVCIAGTAPTVLSQSNAQTGPSIPLTAAPAVYVIEESTWDPAEGNQYYTLRATGVGRTSDHVTTLISSYIKHTPFIDYQGAVPNTTFRLRSLSQNAYRIPYPGTTAIAATTSIGTSDQALWKMCVLDNGTVNFYEQAISASYFTHPQRYFLGLNTLNQISTNGDAQAISDFTTLPAQNYFTFKFLYTDPNSTITQTIGSTPTLVNEPNVLKTVFQLQASNGYFVRAIPGPGGAPDFTLTADVSGPPASSDLSYQFKVELTSGRAAAPAPAPTPAPVPAPAPTPAPSSSSCGTVCCAEADSMGFTCSYGNYCPGPHDYCCSHTGTPCT